MNAISKIAAALLAVLLLYIYPAVDSFERQDDIAYLLANQSVVNFVDSVRNKGYITPTMYNDFVQGLEQTGNLFEIRMEHNHKLYHPVYADAANPNTFQSTYEVSYDGYYQEHIMSVLFPQNELPPDDPERRYRLAAGDYFRVTVSNRNRTSAAIMRDALNLSNKDEIARIYIPYGGMVLNEDD